MTPRRFREQMDYLASEGYRVVNILEAVRLLRKRDDPASHRLPQLRRRLPRRRGERARACSRSAAFGRRCSSRPASRTEGSRSPGAAAGRRLLSWEQIVELDREGTLEFEAHTISHPNLLLVDDDRARAEIEGSKAELEDRLGRSVTAFCYPAGLFGERERRLVADAGFGTAVSCEPGVNHPGTDRLALRRRQIDARDRLLDFRAKLGGGHDTPLPLRGTYRRLRYGERPPPAGELAAVDGDMRLLKRLQTEVLANALAAVRSQPAPKRGIDEEAFERRREPNGIPRWHEQARLAVLDRFRHAADRRGDDGQPRGHRLEDRERQPFGGAREHEDVGAREQSATSSRSPRSTTARSSRAAGSPPRGRARSGPSPTITAEKPVRMRPRARTSVSGSLGRCSRPTDDDRRDGAVGAGGHGRVRIDTVSDHDRSRSGRRLGRDPGGALALGDADRDRRQRPHHPLRPQVQRRGDAMWAAKAHPCTVKIRIGTPESRGESPEHAGLGAVRVNDVRPLAAKERDELEQAAEIAPRAQRPPDLLERDGARSRSPRSLQQRAGTYAATTTSNCSTRAGSNEAT